MNSLLLVHSIFFSVKALGIILGGCLSDRTPATTAVKIISNHPPLMSSISLFPSIS